MLSKCSTSVLCCLVCPRSIGICKHYTIGSYAVVEHATDIGRKWDYVTNKVKSFKIGNTSLEDYIPPIDADYDEVLECMADLQTDRGVNRMISNLKNGMRRMKEKEEYAKLSIALQDLNACYELEKRSPHLFRKELRALRKFRNQHGGHYITKDEEKEAEEQEFADEADRAKALADAIALKEYKTHKVLQQLQRMLPVNRARFEQEYGGQLVPGVLKSLKKQYGALPASAAAVDKRDKLVADNWWN